MESIIWIRTPTEEQKEFFAKCKVWSKEPSTWKGSKQTLDETFLVIEGNAYVELPDGRRFRFSKGDLVTLPAHEDNAWTWHVEEQFTKHYVFEKGANPS